MVLNATLELSYPSVWRPLGLESLDIFRIYDFLPDVECMVEEVDVETLLLPLVQIPSHPSDAVHDIVIALVDASERFYARVGYVSFDSNRGFLLSFSVRVALVAGRLTSFEPSRHPE
jgi:hypothetical protein